MFSYLLQGSYYVMPLLLFTYYQMCASLGDIIICLLASCLNVMVLLPDLLEPKVIFTGRNDRLCYHLWCTICIMNYTNKAGFGKYIEVPHNERGTLVGGRRRIVKDDTGAATRCCLLQFQVGSVVFPTYWGIFIFQLKINSLLV